MKTSRYRYRFPINMNKEYNCFTGKLTVNSVLYKYFVFKELRHWKLIMLNKRKSNLVKMNTKCILLSLECFWSTCNNDLVEFKWKEWVSIFCQTFTTWTWKYMSREFRKIFLFFVFSNAETLYDINVQ